ncbi:MAG: exodeoxyribonuclease V subunit beta [Deltaproteobacteria bacterium]|nr:exodeoxyribonuclease V subunit beta [Deltaproteobacteria bacterium]
MQRFDAASQPLLGVHLIEASAGTGKTYSITLLVLRQIVEKGIPLERILVVTFTDAATAELKEKVYQRLSDAMMYLEQGAEMVPKGEAAIYQQIFSNINPADCKQRLRQALLQFDRAQIFTIHGFCRRILFDNAFEIGLRFGLELTKESSAFFNTLAKDFWLAYCAKKPPLLIDLFHRHELGVETLATLGQRLYSKPSILIRSVGTVRNGVDLYMGAYAMARKVFWECADRLPGMFLLAKGINKRSYSKATVPRWVEDAKLIFAEKSPVTMVPDSHSLERFSWCQMVETATADIQIEETVFFKAVDALLAARKRLNEEVAALRYIFTQYVEDIGRRRREKEGLVFFDDLLLELQKALLGDNGPALKKIIKMRYDAAMIDEFQDTDSTQYDVFKSLFIDEQIPFFMIGDPKQAIYAFRGGDIFTYMSAAKKVEDNAWSLGINWRSSRDLVSAVNEMFLTRNAFLFDAIAFHPVSPHPASDSVLTYDSQREPGFQFLFCTRTESNCKRNKDDSWKQLAATGDVQVQRLCQDISTVLSGRAHINGNPITAGDIAVLVRKHDQGRRVRDALAQIGILASISKTESVFETVAATELFEVMLAISENSVALLKTALSTIAFNIKGPSLLHLVSSNDRLDKYQAAFSGFRQTFENHGIVALINELLTYETVSGDGGLKARVLKAGENAYLTDFLQLLSILGNAFFTRRVPFEQVLEQLEKWLHLKPTDEAFTRQGETDTSAVQILTIHKSKGLQFPVVYLPFSLKDTLAHKNDVVIFHDPTAENTEVCDLNVPPPDDALRLQEMEQRAENMRLLYVALTRAQHACKVILGNFNGMESSSLARLLFGDDTDAIRRMDDAALVERLTAFCQKCGAVVITEEDSAQRHHERPVFADTHTEAPTNGVASLALIENFTPLQFRAFSCQMPKVRSHASFSSLIHSALHYSESPELSETGFGVLTANGHGDSDMALSQSDYSNGFLGLHPQFGRGAVFGSMVHDIFETRFRCKENPVPLATIADTALSKYGLKGDFPANALTEWIDDVFAVSPDNAVSLDTIQRSGNALPEMAFVIPVDDKARFSPDGLRDAMTIGAMDDTYARYARQLSSLHFSSLIAYLKGFIDLVYAQEGKFYIADYKTNDLGNRQDNYTSDALKTDMAAHHYYLQYHLYTLALHRYLKWRLPNYSYSDHFGGVFYLYVRGMSSACSSCGVFMDRPPKERIEALDALLRSGENGES